MPHELRRKRSAYVPKRHACRALERIENDAGVNIAHARDLEVLAVVRRNYKLKRLALTAVKIQRVESPAPPHSEI